MRALVLALVLWSAPGRACSPYQPELHEIDLAERAIDKQPPGPTRILASRVSRSAAASCDSCASEASLELTVDLASDDRTRPEEMGYLLEVVSSDPQAWIPKEAMRTLYGKIYIEFSGSYSLDLTLRVTAIDRAGNRGAASEPFRVHEGSGCAVTRGARFDLALPLVLAILWVRRRRAVRVS